MDAHAEPTLNELLTAFCSQDEARSARAFEKLSVITRRGLHAYLRGKLYSEEGREDVIQDTLKRIWTKRDKFQNKGPSAWWSLVKRAADQCRIDLVRKTGAEVAWDDSELGEIPDKDQSTIDTLLDALDEEGRFYTAADELFLGFPPALTERDRARRVLAAQLFFVEKMPWDQVCDLLNRGGQEPKVTRPQLDIWLTAPSTIRSLAFRTLYQDNDRLTAYLLDLSLEDLNHASTQAMSPNPAAKPPANWTWPETRVIIWRYREAERPDKILSLELCNQNKEELTHLFDRCLQNFPFIPLMKQLGRDLALWPQAKQELAEAGLWQRLVLQIYCKDSTQHRDIFDRTAPAATLVPYHLTAGMLNAWLSNGRLFAKLAAYLQNPEADR